MRRTVFVLIIAFLVFSSWVVWERHEITSCFNMSSCVLNTVSATEGIILMQRHEDEWRIVTYRDGNLTLHILKLEGTIIPRVEHSTESTKTYADYSPLSFEAKGVEKFKSIKEGIIAKSSNTVKVFEGDSLKELMQNPTHCHEFPTLCPECKAVLGDSWAVVRLGRTDITGGYLVFPSEKSAVQHSFSKSFPTTTPTTS